MLYPDKNGEQYVLESPVKMPQASAFLWNPHMMIQVSCRGYAVAQFMQPEPARYAHSPLLQARTFMQPEQPYFAHHPGRFVYIKEEKSGALFSLPYEPVRQMPERFRFIAGKHTIGWEIEQSGLHCSFMLTLAKDRPLELWHLQIRNISAKRRNISVYPYFPVGYMSWMNQQGEYRKDLQGIVCSCVTPYQKYPDYFKNQDFKDKTFFLTDQKPDAWEVQQAAFEGEGGLHNPTATRGALLADGDARYETPAAILQYRLGLEKGETRDYRFAFGPAKDDREIAGIRQDYLQSPQRFSVAAKAYADYIGSGSGCLQIRTPDRELDNFVNHWLPRQVFYHGDVNRLTTDPQTRNYLQDNMGMSYIRPAVTRAAILQAVAQQKTSGAMPDGILLTEDAELKYINQVPHTDHCVWLPICLQAYLEETDDYGLLDEEVGFGDGPQVTSLAEHIHLAMRWLLQDRDRRGLSFIAQGDWCDPMNMVGYKGKGVSGWLTLAAAYALNTWSEVCRQIGKQDLAAEFRQGADHCNTAANQHIWEGQWYGRGITDDGRLFGTSHDAEGRIFLNPQGWALLSGAADKKRQKSLIRAVEEHLETPYGVAMLAPPFTKMWEDIGRVTQKFPGSAENGSVYNHAAAFYIYGLYRVGEGDRAFRLLRQMLPGPAEADYLQRGQLPVFIPNYYRGAYRQYPQRAGRSSQLFNTGTVHWFYRCLIDGLFGVRGDRGGLILEPQLPAEWQSAEIVREFRGATFNIIIRRDTTAQGTEVKVDGAILPAARISDIQPGRTYTVEIRVPATAPHDG